jgi:hypothetical protein
MPQVAIRGIGESLSVQRRGDVHQMKAISINGSPGKKWNTAILLQKAFDGAASVLYTFLLSSNDFNALFANVLLYS